MVVDGVVAIGAALAAGSLTLMAFGFDSVIELASAVVLMWRLDVELRLGQRFSEHAERTARRIGGALLFTPAACIVAGAGWSLWTRHAERFSMPGLAIAVLALPIMILLARRKIAIADPESRAARRCRREHHLRLVVFRRRNGLVGGRRDIAGDPRFRCEGSTRSMERRGVLRPRSAMTTGEPLRRFDPPARGRAGIALRPTLPMPPDQGVSAIAAAPLTASRRDRRPEPRGPIRQS